VEFMERHPEREASKTQRKKKKKGVCHIVALPFTLKKYGKAKSRIIETQIFHHAKNTIFKKLCKINQNPSRYYNSITNISSFNTSQNIIFQKSFI
jgi:hypothetical protein